MSVLQLLPIPPRSTRRLDPVRGQELVGAGETAMQRLRGSRMALIPQEPLTSLNPLHRVERQIAEAIRLHRPGTGKARCRERVLELLSSSACAIRCGGCAAIRTSCRAGSASG
jgi:microcin C transport system ATP-binding protein